MEMKVIMTWRVEEMTVLCRVEMEMAWRMGEMEVAWRVGEMEVAWRVEEMKVMWREGEMVERTKGMNTASYNCTPNTMDPI